MPYWLASVVFFCVKKAYNKHGLMTLMVINIRVQSPDTSDTFKRQNQRKIDELCITLSKNDQYKYLGSKMCCFEHGSTFRNPPCLCVCVNNWFYQFVFELDRLTRFPPVVSWNLTKSCITLSSLCLFKHYRETMWQSPAITPAKQINVSKKETSSPL